ncbi:MAG: hypothetical protein ACRD7E_17225 [Bryobacteraceae bacterium]
MLQIPGIFIVIALAIESLFVALYAFGDLSRRITETILLLLLTTTVYLLSVFFVLRLARSSRRFILFVFLAALVFRATVWPLFPAFSDDVYRYRWEGKLQDAGGNPYQVRPNDPEWSELRDPAFDNVGSKDFKGGYGPLIELTELFTYRVLKTRVPDPFAQVFWFKLPSVLFDLASMVVLAALLRARGLPMERVLIYAWSPLPVFEYWVNGHNDSMPVFFVLLALLAASWGRWTWSFVWLSLATAAKLWPVVLFPLFIFWRGARPIRWYQWLVVIPLFGLISLPYWSVVTENLHFLTGFIGGWRNNDSLFGLLLFLVDDLYRAKHIAFGILAASVVWATTRKWPLEKCSLFIIVAMLLVASNCHPWYLLWFLPLLAFVPFPPLLLWTALMPLCYAVVIRWLALGEWEGSTAIRWYVYVPFYVFLITRSFVLLLQSRRANVMVKP